MSFIVDKQTLDDLHIFGKFRKDALYNLFNATQTRGGAQLLEELFLYPMADGARIRKRSSIIRYFTERNIAFPFQQDAFDAIEHYLENIDDRTRLAAEDDTLQRKLRIYMGADAAFEWLQKGMIACIDVFNTLKGFLNVLQPADVPPAFSTEIKEMQALLADEQLNWMLQEKGAKKLTFAKAAEYDRLLRFHSADKIQKLLQHIYQMDVYMAVAKVAVSKGYVFAEVMDGSSNNIQINGMYHPYLANPIANSLHIDHRSNVIFLTGANMAGKSTFMKTLGITVYLAHMGFPVPAQSMQFTVLRGLFTTINLADNLGMGYSHFYAEVLRLKKIAQQVNRAENILIIFDELFRGTNVKDAYDATVAVTEAFAAKQNCTFIISTHIMEAGEELRAKCPTINFVYFPTVMKENKPAYTYQLTPGITSDRHGMMIINHERIIEIIKSRQTPNHPDMHFTADKQTLDDLNILGKYKGNSIINLFNHTHTRGGSQVLERMFQHPMCDAAAINARSSLLQYFQSKSLQFPVSRELCEEVEHYLSAGTGNGFAGTAAMIIQKKVLRIIGSDPAYELMQTGMLSLRKLLQVLKAWYAGIDEGTKATPYQETIRQMQQLFQHSGLQVFLSEQESDLPVGKMVRYDHLLRHSLHHSLTQLMQYLYELDVYITVSKVSAERDFHYAHAVPWAELDNRIIIHQVTHPQVLGAVANSVSLRREANMIFLTGANMAGKSTFMKSVGIAIYLAHMGFPVAAAGMEFSVQDGLYTSINVADNLQQGYSHFYAEVLRVKQVAEEVSRSKNLVIIFDELFKGTNVKDAYDATVAVTEAFGGNSNVHFIVSTHIVEAGEVLKERCSNMQFVYFPTLMDTGIPRYPYMLQHGISGDRHGMMIIQNESIIEIIRGIA